MTETELRAERDAIEHRAYFDTLRLAEIRAELERIAGDWGRSDG